MHPCIVSVHPEQERHRFVVGELEKGVVVQQPKYSNETTIVYISLRSGSQVDSSILQNGMIQKPNYPNVAQIYTQVPGHAFIECCPPPLIVPAFEKLFPFFGNMGARFLKFPAFVNRDNVYIREYPWFPSTQAPTKDKSVNALNTLWFTTNRFKPEVIEFRLNRHRIVTERNCQELLLEIEKGDLLKANQRLNDGVNSLTTYLLEKWGERDNSFARIGTRFERTAKIHGQENLPSILNYLSNLNAEQVRERIVLAPDWVQKRHERSWRARKLIGEQVTKIQDARDVLRVFSRYELRKQTDDTFPVWLGVDTDLTSLNHKANEFVGVLSGEIG